MYTEILFVTGRGRGIARRLEHGYGARLSVKNKALPKGNAQRSFSPEAKRSLEHQSCHAGFKGTSFSLFDTLEEAMKKTQSFMGGHNMVCSGWLASFLS
jgi:hypothetical protein